MIEFFRESLLPKNRVRRLSKEEVQRIIKYENVSGFRNETPNDTISKYVNNSNGHSRTRRGNKRYSKSK